MDRTVCQANARPFFLNIVDKVSYTSHKWRRVLILYNWHVLLADSLNYPWLLSTHCVSVCLGMLMCVLAWFELEYRDESAMVFPSFDFVNEYTVGWECTDIFDPSLAGSKFGGHLSSLSLIFQNWMNICFTELWVQLKIMMFVKHKVDSQFFNIFLDFWKNKNSEYIFVPHPNIRYVLFN